MSFSQGEWLWFSWSQNDPCSSRHCIFVQIRKKRMEGNRSGGSVSGRNVSRIPVRLLLAAHCPELWYRARGVWTRSCHGTVKLSTTSLLQLLHLLLTLKLDRCSHCLHVTSEKPGVSYGKYVGQGLPASIGEPERKSCSFWFQSPRPSRDAWRLSPVLERAHLHTVCVTLSASSKQAPKKSYRLRVWEGKCWNLRKLLDSLWKLGL